MYYSYEDVTIYSGLGGIEKVTVNGEIVLESDGTTSYIIRENGTYDIVVINKEGKY